MSQIFTVIFHEGRPMEVMAGWDRPLEQFFVNGFKNGIENGYAVLDCEATGINSLMMPSKGYHNDDEIFILGYLDEKRIKDVLEQPQLVAMQWLALAHMLREVGNARFSIVLNNDKALLEKAVPHLGKEDVAISTLQAEFSNIEIEKLIGYGVITTSLEKDIIRFNQGNLLEKEVITTDVLKAEFGACYEDFETHHILGAFPDLEASGVTIYKVF